MTKIMIRLGSYQISKHVDPDLKGYYALEDCNTNEIVGGSNRVADLLPALMYLNEEKLPEVQVWLPVLQRLKRME